MLVAMSDTPHNIGVNATPQTADTKSPVVFILAVMFFIVAILLIMAQSYIQIDPVWELLAIPFNLAMTGALILFHFLSSSASIDKQVYKVGGAIAGFLVLFSIF